LVTELRSRHPEDHILSEEGLDDPARLGAPRVWIIDPLDGTREYMETPRLDWAVHVALVVEETPAAGAIAIPEREILYWTGARNLWAAHADSAPRLVVSRTRPPAFATRLAETLGLELVEMGSAGAKTAAVLAGEAVAYVHDGGMHEWDAAAPVAVAAATGFHASHLDGSTLRFNQPRPRIRDLLVCRRERAGEILTCLDRCW
jgi:3'(2'), 5'-bisphosphate nucleotidase